MDLSIGEEPISTFTQAVKRTFDLAMARLPKDLHGHLERAHALVLHHHVFPTDDGKHAQVLSSDGERWYPVNGHCTCMDATKASQGLCKHRLAFGLYRRASELLVQQGVREQGVRHEGSEGDVPGLALVPRPSLPPSLPEAPASVNVRVKVGGHECQWTLRDVSEDRLAQRLEVLLTRYPEAVCAGTPQREQASAAPPAGPPVCQWHGPLKESTKAPGTWFCSKKMADGSYCSTRHPER